jgi:hypothetical protein
MEYNREANLPCPWKFGPRWSLGPGLGGPVKKIKLTNNLQTE